MSAKREPCLAVVAFLRAHHGAAFLGPMTGQDRAALLAFVHAAELYAIGDHQGRACATIAMAAAVSAMQPKCRPIAQESIPAVMDWTDRDPVWDVVLRAIDGLRAFGRDGRGACPDCGCAVCVRILAGDA